jgi:hypothetical protein
MQNDWKKLWCYECGWGKEGLVLVRLVDDHWIGMAREFEKDYGWGCWDGGGGGEWEEVPSTKLFTGGFDTLDGRPYIRVSDLVEEMDMFVCTYKSDEEYEWPGDIRRLKEKGVYMLNNMEVKEDGSKRWVGDLGI